MNAVHLFEHYRSLGARVPRDRISSMQGMACVRRTLDGKYVAGEITKSGTVELGRFQLRDFESGTFDWVSFSAIDAGDAFLTHSRGDANAILACLRRADSADVKVA